MNTILALSVSTASLTIAFAIAGVILIIAIAFKFGPNLDKEHNEFLDEVKEEFPGCTIKKEDHCEVIIEFEGQPFMVRKGQNGEMESTPHEPDAHEALV